MKYLIFTFLLCPFTAFAKCNNLTEFLIKEYPNRVLIENYGYDGTYAIFEPSLKEKKSNISIIGCEGSAYKQLKSFSLPVREIDGLEYSNEYEKMFVYFVYETEQYGWISKKEDYTFELSHDPEL